MNMSSVVEFLSDASLFIGCVLALCAFLVERGWRNPWGMTFLAVGGIIVAASLMNAPDGQTWARYGLASALGGY
jgi:drug/metabolite transporter superfamily protein YnfA